MGRSRNPNPLHQPEAPPSAPGWPEIEAREGAEGRPQAHRRSRGAVKGHSKRCCCWLRTGSSSALSPQIASQKEFAAETSASQVSGTPLTQEGKELGPQSPNLGGEWQRVGGGCLCVRGGSDFIDNDPPSVTSSSPEAVSQKTFSWNLRNVRKKYSHRKA